MVAYPSMKYYSAINRANYWSYHMGESQKHHAKKSDTKEYI